MASYNYLPRVATVSRDSSYKGIDYFPNNTLFWAQYKAAAQFPWEKFACVDYKLAKRAKKYATVRGWMKDPCKWCGRRHQARSVEIDPRSLFDDSVKVASCIHG